MIKYSLQASFLVEMHDSNVDTRYETLNFIRRSEIRLKDDEVFIKDNSYLTLLMLNAVA